MTLVTGTVQDLGYDGMEGTLWARPARFRSDGSVVYAPERKPFTITGGVVSAELAPGPAVLELQVGSHARGTFEVVIPDTDITLADLLDTVFPWEPAQVSQFVAERELAVQAKTAAETAAGQASTAAGTATTAAQQTGQDRTAVAADKQVVVGHVQALAAPNDAAVLGLISEGATTQTKAALNATYAVMVQIVADGTDQTAQINQALLARSPYGLRTTVKLVGEFTITAPLVIHSQTRLDTTDATVTKIDTANFKMLHNSAMYGTGARDHGIEVFGGFWERPTPAPGATPVAEPNDAHSILFHRADHVSVTDIRFAGDGPIKYAVYGVDVTHFTTERLDITSTSDGVHITGPASHITIRDIIGTVEDDLISFTGRDYVNWELTPGGGDISDLLVERVRIREGDGNVVKLLPGLGKKLSGAVVRNVSGNPEASLVTLYGDEVDPATTGGVLEDILIDGVSGSPVHGYMVNVRHEDVRDVKIRNVTVTALTMARVISFNQTGRVRSAQIDGITCNVPFAGPLVHVGTGMTVDELQLSNVSAEQSATGSIVANTGHIGTAQLSNIVHKSGRALADIQGGTLGRLVVNGLHSTALLGLFLNAVTTVEMFASGVSSVPTSGLLASLQATGASILLRGSDLTGAGPHIGRNNPGTLRAVGAAVRADAALLSPQAGDIVHNTNATLPCGIGPVAWTGTAWTSLAVPPPVQITRSWDVPNIEPGRSVDLTTSMGAGTAAVGDFARAVPPPDFPAGLIWSAFVSAADTVTVRVANMTASAINPAPGTWKVAVNKT